MKIELPKVGQIWERDGLQRMVVSVMHRSDFKENDYDIVWSRPGEDKTHTIWLPYWKQWRNKAHLVI